MADLRSTFRFTAPALVEAGYRVAIIDLRGHGDSATDFDRYDNRGNAADVAALIEHLGGPAVSSATRWVRRSARSSPPSIPPSSRDSC